MMKRMAFQQAVDAKKQRLPFQPFAVELDDGERLVVRVPKALMCYGGAAMYFRDDGELMQVESEDVRQLVDLIDKASA